MTNRKPILCLDFDGVLHSYSSGWKGADVIPDPPVPGAMDFIIGATARFNVQIYSSRSGQPGGIKAMKFWLRTHMVAHLSPTFKMPDIEGMLDEISFPTEKPPAFVTLDDRAIQFTGTFPVPNDLLDFKPWNK